MTAPYGSTNTDDPEQIRRDIEHTQAALSNDVDTLTEKVSPGRIVERRVGRVRSRVQDLKDRVMGSDRGSSPYSSPAGGGVRDTAQHAADAVSQTASSAGSAVSEAASGAAEAVQEAPRAIRRQAEGNPLAAGLIAFGVGWLVSSVLPATRREQELTEQARDRAADLGGPIADAAKHVAADMKDNLAGPAQQAVESVRSTAADAGRTVADEGRDAADQVQGDARHAAGHVQRSASQG